MVNVHILEVGLSMAKLLSCRTPPPTTAVTIKPGGTPKSVYCPSRMQMLKSAIGNRPSPALALSPAMAGLSFYRGIPISNMSSCGNRWAYRFSIPTVDKTKQCRKIHRSISDESTLISYPSSDVDCVIVGAGISGLCIAQNLVSYHARVASNLVVTEAMDRVGGAITTMEKDGYLWEEGPNSFQPSDHMLALAVDNGLKDDIIFGDPDYPRFVLWNEKLRSIPSKPTELFSSDLLSFNGKLRACLGLIGYRPPPLVDEESVEEFTRRNFGDEVFERLIDPFCSGVYAGDPSKLSMKAAFGQIWKLEKDGRSIFSGVLKAFMNRKSSKKSKGNLSLEKPKGQTVGSFRKGLAMLPEAISSRLGERVKLCWKLLSISKKDDGKYFLVYETPQGEISLHAKSVILTIPAFAASSLLQPISCVAAEALSKIYYPPVAVVCLSYPEGAIRRECLVDHKLKGFGQLHPRSQGVETLGTIYSSSLFPDRAPPGRVVLSSFIGGATNPGISKRGEEEIVERVHRDLRRTLLSPDAEGGAVLGVRVWERAIPQLERAHLRLTGSAEDALKDGGSLGLFLAGSYSSGVALGHCVEKASEIASSAADFLSNPRP